MIGYVVFAFAGLIVGTIAKALVPGRDPGFGVTILLGTAAQVPAGFALRSLGWDRYGQPWSFFLSIGVAAVLLFAYREYRLDEILARRAPERAGASPAMQRSVQASEALWRRMAFAPAWAAIGGIMLGATGFLIGFFGPLRFQPWANQGPMLGIFVTGPVGVLLGGLIGAGLRIARPDWPTRWRLWALNAVTVAYGLLVLDIVIDRSWWR